MTANHVTQHSYSSAAPLTAQPQNSLAAVCVVLTCLVCVLFFSPVCVCPHVPPCMAHALNPAMLYYKQPPVPAHTQSPYTHTHTYKT